MRLIHNSDHEAIRGILIKLTFVFYFTTCRWCSPWYETHVHVIGVHVHWGVLEESGVSATVQVAQKQKATSKNHNTYSWSHTRKRDSTGKYKGNTDEADMRRWQRRQGSLIPAVNLVHSHWSSPLWRWRSSKITWLNSYNSDLLFKLSGAICKKPQSSTWPKFHHQRVYA